MREKNRQFIRDGTSMQRFLPILLLLLLAACNRSTSQDPLPTLAAPEAIATGLVLTENAPPAGFDSISFPHIDANVEFLSGWRAEIYFAFNGVYARTTRNASVSTQATVYYDQVGSARRILATLDNDLEESEEAVLFEGVRLGPDAFLVRDGSCIQAAQEDAGILTSLGAGDLLGGVQAAQVEPRKARINNTEVWLYRFGLEEMRLPNVQFPEDARVLQLNSELWFDPVQNVVIRYYVTMEVENALLLNQNLPVTGTVILRYDLLDIGTIPNITVPFGC